MQPNVIRLLGAFAPKTLAETTYGAASAVAAAVLFKNARRETPPDEFVPSAIMTIELPTG
jgi:hypothetical protein